MERNDKPVGGSKPSQVEKLEVADNAAILRDLDSIRIEFGKVGIGFALAQTRISRGHRENYRKNVKAYGEALDRLQALLPKLAEWYVERENEPR